MSKSSDSQYLESKVLTASQSRLHLMLLEGALRLGWQAKETWSNFEGLDEPNQFVNRMMNIVEELTMSVTVGEGEISKQLEEQYAFLYRELATSRINRDLQKLEDCMKLLEIHRETWRMVCEKEAPESETRAVARVVPPHHLSQNPSESFSFEA